LLDKLIARETNSAEFGFLGSDYIDVLQLNEALAKTE
jgi:K+-transporting ATPase c subunit